MKFFKILHDNSNSFLEDEASRQSSLSSRIQFASTKLEIEDDNTMMSNTSFGFEMVSPNPSSKNTSAPVCLSNSNTVKINRNAIANFDGEGLIPIQNFADNPSTKRKDPEPSNFHADTHQSTPYMKRIRHGSSAGAIFDVSINCSSLNR